MAYDKIINRTKAEATIPVEVSNELFAGIIEESFVLKHARKLPNMNSKQTRIPVADSLPVAGFVNGDTGLKETSDVSWKNVYLNAEEIAVIVPIPEAVLDDSTYDIFEEVKPLIIQAFGKVIDEAVLYGTNKPASWAEGIVTQAKTNNKSHTIGASEKLYDTINETLALVEESGFVPQTLVAGVDLKKGFRGMVDTIGQPIKNTEIDSIDRTFVANGSWDKTQAKLLVGDFSNLVYAIRQDMTFKILDQAVISDASGNVVLNLAQQDSVALRCVMRLGWNVPNPVTALDGTGTRFPFAVAVTE